VANAARGTLIEPPNQFLINLPDKWLRGRFRTQPAAKKLFAVDRIYIPTSTEKTREKWGLVTRWLRGRIESYLSTFRLSGAGGGNRTHGLGIMRPSLFH
jgi:hypothetical protein